MRIADAIGGLGLGESVMIYGNLLPVPPGIVAGEEEPSSNIEVGVAVQPRRMDDFGWLNPLNFPCAIAVTFRAEAFPTIFEVAPILGKVFDLVTAWVRTTDGVGVGGDLETGTFLPGGVRIDNGDGPRFDDESCAWRASLNFTVRGRIKTNEEVN